MRFLTGIVTCLLWCAAIQSGSAQPVTNRDYRDWVQQMKTAERGPFSRLRWFCADGTILPPTPFACREHGGGRQHGEYTDRTQALRDNGYLIANVLAATTPEAVLENEA
ncbi:MAG: pyruvate phosphate dikinase, partial [Gammaproteobacteria bacterium]